MKGLLALDIDGTLTHRIDWIDPKVVAFLEELTKDGWQIALLTGRIFAFGWKIFQHLPFPYLLAVQNGADVLEMPQKTRLQQSYFQADQVSAIDRAYSGQSEDFIIYSGIDSGDFCYYRKSRFSPKMLDYLKILESLGAAPWQESDFSFEKDKTFPLIKCFGDENSMRQVNAKLINNKEVEISMIRDPIDTSLYLNLVTHSRACKGKVVQFLKSRVQAPVVIAAGNDLNDLNMLKQADVGIAVENSPKELLESAQVTSASPKELGIIPALKEAIALALS